MRNAALLSLAFALVVAAVLVITGVPTQALAQGGSAAVNDVQVEMVDGNQPETLFPTGVKSVSGRVVYNIRNDAGTPIQRQTTVSVIDVVGLEVFSHTFTTSASYTGSATENFSVSGDQMFAVYKTVASTRVQAALATANATAMATNEIDATRLARVAEVGTGAREASRAIERLLSFAEVPADARTTLNSALQSINQVSLTAAAVVGQPTCVAPPATGTPPPNACTPQRISEFNSNLAEIRTNAQAALNALNTALPMLAGLSNLSIPAISECDRDALGRAVPRTYTTNVIQPSPSGELATRDSWEWQVGTQSSIPVHVLLEAAPISVYSLDVTVAPTHTSMISARALDQACLPVPDNVTVTFRTSIGTVTPITTTTSSAGGQHGLASTTFAAGTQIGTANISFQNITGSTIGTTAVFVVGPAARLSFLAQQGQSEETPRYVQQGGRIELQVQVRDASSGEGRVVADGTPVQFSVTNNAGTFEACPGSTLPVTTRNGLATVCFRAGANAGPAVVTATVPGTSAQDTLEVRVVGAPARLTLGVQQPYSTTLFLGGFEPPRASFTFVEVTVTDAAGQPVADNTEVELRLLSSGRAQWEDPVPGAPLVTRVRTSAGKARAKLIGQAEGTVDVRAFITGVAPSGALTIRIVSPPTYTLYLPMVLKKTQCGRAAAPIGGCISVRAGSNE